jgi:cell division protein FtsB
VKLFVAIGFVVLVSFLFLIGLGNQGAVDLYQLKLQKKHILESNAALQEKNEQLYRTIHRLKEDPMFVENIARTELGMIRNDEMVILKKRR